MTIRGSVDRHGNVTISFNLQADVLGAPDRPFTHEPRIWLPCERCGILVMTRPGTVSIVCNWQKAHKTDFPYVVALDGFSVEKFAVHCRLGHAMVHNQEIADDAKPCEHLDCVCRDDVHAGCGWHPVVGEAADDYWCSVKSSQRPVNERDCPLCSKPFTLDAAGRFPDHGCMTRAGLAKAAKTCLEADRRAAGFQCPQCSFTGTDEEVDEHRATGVHDDEPQAGGNSRPGGRYRVHLHPRGR